MARWGTGSEPGGEWQRAMTIAWLARIGREHDDLPVLFEGQMRIAFIAEGLEAAGIAEARIILVHCDDATRTHRLCHERNQPDLANPDMMNWARYLREEAEASGSEVLDTSKMSIEDSVEYICRSLGIERSGA
ncbi:conserved hypothetical protein [Bradyrhizobium sp. STM 3809]|nr:conserved hypothetical protein [Bradyrhizobium sp. STM 3809]